MSLPNEICKQILELAGSTRFGGIANQTGRPVAVAYQAGVEMVLTKEEIDSHMIGGFPNEVSR